MGAAGRGALTEQEFGKSGTQKEIGKGTWKRTNMRGKKHEEGKDKQ